MERRFYRSQEGKLIGGVCAGLGKYLRIDPWLVRVGFLLLILANGLGGVLYLLLWLFVPTQEMVGRPQGEVLRHNTDEMRAQARTLVQKARGTLHGRWLEDVQRSKYGLFIGGILILLGLAFLLRNFGLFWWLVKLWPLFLIALGTLLLIGSLRRGN